LRAHRCCPTSVDPSRFPELDRSATNTLIVAQLQRELLDPDSLTDLRTCAPFNVKMKDGRPTKWLIYFTVNAKNAYGGYTGRSYYAAIFRAGKPPMLSELVKAGAEGLDRIIVRSVEKDMADCRRIPTEEISAADTAMRVAIALLAACTDKGQEAERRYDMVKRSSASASDLCAAGKALVGAYLEAGDQDKYRHALAITDSECTARSLDERYGIFRDSNGAQMGMVEADNME